MMDKKNTTIKERILQYADLKNVTYKDFLESVDLKYANFKGKQKLSGINSASIERIVSVYPAIDLHWLITGERKNTYSEDVIEEPKIQYDKKDELLEVFRENRAFRKEIDALKEKIESLRKSQACLKNDDKPVSAE